KLLHERGFNVSVARQLEMTEMHTAEVDNRYRALFRKHGLPEDTAIGALPDFGALANGALANFGAPAPEGTSASTAADTREALRQPKTSAARADFLCTYSRMVVKQNGRMRVYACALTDDDSRFDL